MVALRFPKPRQAKRSRKKPTLVPPVRFCPITVFLLLHFLGIHSVVRVPVKEIRIKIFRVAGALKLREIDLEYPESFMLARATQGPFRPPIRCLFVTVLAP